jgi:hypothetical protein
MLKHDYKYYRYRKLKRGLLGALLLLSLLIIISLLICNRNGENAGGDERGEGMPGRSQADHSEKGSGIDESGEGGTIGSVEKGRDDKRSRARSSGMRKTGKRKTSSVKHATVNKVKKVKEEKKAPPKPPTLEIIGEEGKVLMKKE